MSQSYNPPAEYLPTQEEIDEWESTDPQDRKRNFVAQKYSSLRLVPRYDNYIQERFERCLDLYLCPRTRKTRVCRCLLCSVTDVCRPICWLRDIGILSCC